MRPGEFSRCQTTDRVLQQEARELLSVLDTSVLCVIWDKSHLLGGPVALSIAANSGYEVLGHELPVALHKQRGYQNGKPSSSKDQALV